eukprot:TRINITY_DN6832_c0_g1_i1.p1 TRINITY_DN6832_c0_g1~~TRINITY_DN6832_c0_g1_i1.p1  ORF type:complete len:1146 (-),score=120.68 TRINITY_DN6832_c0_g1_i1:215-3652(-)
MGNTTASGSKRNHSIYDAAVRRGLMSQPGYLMKLVHAQDIEGLEELLSTPEGKEQLSYFDPEDDDRLTPLLVAASLGNAALVKLLIEAGADINAKTRSENEGVVHRACSSGSIETLRYLQTVVDFKTLYTGATPVHFAAFNGQLAVVKFLIEECGAPVDTKIEATGSTPLQWSVKRGDGSVTRYLISKGADVEIQDSVGRTAIFHAASSGTIEALKVLVEEGHANVLHRDKYGNTAFAIAESVDMWECTLYLYSVGGGSSGLVRSGGYASAIRFARPRLTGVPLPCRSYGVASTSLPGDRLILFGGLGLPLGQYYSNHYIKLEDLEEPRIPVVRGNDLYMIDLGAPKMSRCAPTAPPARAPHYSRKLDDTKRSHLLELESNRLVARYAQKDSFQPAIVLATRPFHPSGTEYFEITVLKKGVNGFISIGVVREGYPFDRHPGWYATSYGYHGDDGRAFFSSGTGCPWGPRFTEGDTVGLGINFASGEVFFTKNGQFLGVAFTRCPQKSFYPAVGMTSYGEEIRANFGDSPFQFNFETPLYRIQMPPLQGAAPVPLTHPHMFNLDSEGKEILLVGTGSFRGSEIWMYTIQTDTWTSRILDGSVATNKQLQNLDQESFSKLPFDFKWPGDIVSMISTFDSSSRTVWFAYMQGNGGRRVFLRKFNLVSGLWTHVAVLEVPKEFWEQIQSFQTLCMTFVGQFLLVWAPLGDQALYVHYQSQNPILTWDNVPFEGTHVQTTNFSITPLSNTKLLIFGGWDEFGQTNHTFHLDVIASGPICEKLVWSKVRVSGVVPRPRNDHGIFRVSDSLYVAYGGWNGWNNMDDFDLLHIEPESTPDSLQRCRGLSDLDDIKIVCSDSHDVISANRIVLYARSSYFRQIFSADPECREVSIPLQKAIVKALVNFFYSDRFDPEAFDPLILRVFLDDVVGKYAPEHRSRMAQQALLARVHAGSSFSKDMETNAWRNNLFTDVEFVIEEDDEKIRVRAHKAILAARSDFFRAMFSSGLAESKAEVISIRETSREAFSAVIRYIYCGNVDIEHVESYVVDLLIASTKFAVPGLKTFLEGVISQSLTVENVGSLLLIADQLEARSLRQACCHFIQMHQQTLDTTVEYLEILSEVEAVLRSAKSDASSPEYEDVRWIMPRDPMAT